MVIGRMLMRGSRGGVHDPAAAAKALVITALFYAAMQHFDPGQHRGERLVWAATEEARVPVALFVVAVVLVINLLGSYQTLWRKLTFVNVPRTKREIHRGR